MGKYKSIYSDKMVEFPQYLAEKMCERRAKTLERDLPKYFWNTLPEWAKYFKYQLSLARALSNKYDHKSINEAIIELNYVFSLKVKKLTILIDKISKRLPHKEVADIVVLPGGKGRFIRKKGPLGKLDD